MANRARIRLSPAEDAARRAQLDAWLRAHGWSDAELARAMGCSLVNVQQKLARPNIAAPRPLTFQFLANAQRVTGLSLLPPDAPAPGPAPPELNDGALDRLAGFLGEVRIARAGQLARLAGLAESTFRRRVPELVAAGLLAVAAEPLAAPGQPAVYGLGAVGARRAAALLGRGVPLVVGKDGRLKASLPLAHDLAVTEIALAATLALGPALVDLVADAAGRVALPGLAGRRHAEPDLVLLVRDAGGLFAAWVEYETGSGGPARVAEKVRAIDAYARAGLSQDWHTDRIRSLWVTPDEAHARRLVTWVGRERPWVHAWFARLPALAQHGVDGPVWWIVNGGERPFRLIAPEGLPA